jgi:hypothetical protein
MLCSTAQWLTIAGFFSGLKEGAVMSGLFAFNVAVDVEPVEVVGSYDPEQQLWVGGSESHAGGSYVNTYAGRTCQFSGTTTTCNAWGCGADDVWDFCHNDYNSDWDCDNTLPGPC